jgi:flavin reductase (DIM6/NTAB) family NADH-FMN oxidoreductase RutF
VPAEAQAYEIWDAPETGRIRPRRARVRLHAGGRLPRPRRKPTLPVSSDEFRAALSRWVSGVTIVTAAAADRVHGMTVSAFASVSLDPPLVLVCADKSSITMGLIEEGGCFCANVLARGQEALSNRFASKKDEHRRFEGLSWRRATTGAPLLAGVIAALDCRVVAAHDAGDHVIYVGEVEEVSLAPGEPLVYYEGAYRRLGSGP